MHRIGLLVSLVLPFTFLGASATAQPDADDPYAKQVAKASDDWKRTIQRMKLPSGVKADLWAAEPHVANIVAFHFDEKGRCYVAETFRLHHGVTDNRNHPRSWTDDDLACRTVDDRVAMYKKHLGSKFPTYEKDGDRVRLVEDTKGSGRADKSTILAGDFKTAASGLGSGVLARHGKVWYTCIPDLWLLEDTKGTGKADVKKSLHTGYGVHTAFIGHDMHGLKMGPDGKLYFSIGDRGLHVKIAGKTISNPDSGAVLRCNPDGTDLEIFATGLRNPQELAFDEFGNLFTGDNNADGGDQARWVHVVEGGDSGWRMAYQYMPSLGPWNSEKLWHTQATNTGSYLLPPLAHIANGPSGLTYHPGTSLLPDKYAKHFFLCDFRGSGDGSGIHAFQLKPKGASFELVNRQQFVWSVLAVDCDFGPDGGFYLSDWVDGWNQPEKGRIYKLFDPDKINDATVRNVKRLLAEGFAKRSAEELAKLLEHPDQRIRQEAQFTLADKRELAILGRVAARSKNTLARLHAIWALSQIARRLDPREEITAAAASKAMVMLTEEVDPTVRAEAFKSIVRDPDHLPEMHAAFMRGIADKDSRVRFSASLAAGRNSDKTAVPAILDMLKSNNDADPFLRHAGVMALVGIGDKDAIKRAAADASLSVRLASLLAMRRLQMPEIADFLNDIDKQIVLEAARAIYDVPIAPALTKLAERAKHTLKDVPDPVVLRILAANYRLGTIDNAQALANVATRSDVPTPLREQALKMLQAWEKPAGRDWVVGMWRPLPERPSVDVAEVLRPALAALMTGPDKIRTEGAKLAAKHGMKEVGPALRAIVADAKQSAAARIASLQALETLKDAKLDETAKTALADADPRLRHQGRRIVLQKVSKADAVGMLSDVLAKGATVERQGALELLAKLQTAEADGVLELWLDQLIAKKAPPDIQLDVILAAADSKSVAVKKKLASYESTRDAKNPMSVYREAVVGGDAEAGRKVFFEKTEVSCLRCHKINAVGGEVGPDLTGIGKKQKRDYLLESIVDPNKQIAKGYETVVIELKNGQTKIGILKSEDAKEVRIMTAEGQLLAIPKLQIEERSRGPSAMPSDLTQKMSRREVRDLVEFLAGLQ